MNFRISNADFNIVSHRMSTTVFNSIQKRNTPQALLKVIDIWQKRNLDSYTIKVYKDSIYGYLYIPIKQDESLPIVDLGVLNLMYEL